MTETHEAYNTAMTLLHNQFAVTCIPVVDDAGERDVAVVALAPHPIAFLSLMHPDRDTRLRALISVAKASHELLPDKGLTYAANRH